MSRTIFGRHNWQKYCKLQDLLINGEIPLDDLAQLVPGILHINNRTDLSFEYLSPKGCKLIRYSVEQLKRKGSKVLEEHQSSFTREVVHPRVLKELNNCSIEKGILFYQDWKLDGKTSFFFLTTTRNWDKHHLISISFFPEDITYLTPKVNKIFGFNKELERYYSGYNQLTVREKEILALLANESTRQEIASQLYLAKGTVKKHCENIYRKLGTHKRIELEKISKIQIFECF